MKGKEKDDIEIKAARINAKGTIAAAVIALFATIGGTFLGSILESSKGQVTINQTFYGIIGDESDSDITLEEIKQNYIQLQSEYDSIEQQNQTLANEKASEADKLTAANEKILELQSQSNQEIEGLKSQINELEELIQAIKLSIETENSSITYNENYINAVFVGQDNMDNTTINNGNYYTSDDSENHTEDTPNKESTEERKYDVETKVRLVGHDDKTFHSSVYAEIGDIVEFQIQYENISDETHFQVAVRDILPQNLKYISGSTKIYNTNHPKGISIIEDNLVTNGIIIGNYCAGANAYIRFRAEVISDTLAEGVNLLYNWGQAQADASDQIILQDVAWVIVNHHKD